MDLGNPYNNYAKAEAIPCLFPHTELPEIDNESVYSVYFNRGLTLEADVIAQYFKNQKPEVPLQSRIVQIHDAGSRYGSIPANRLSESISKMLRKYR